MDLEEIKRRLEVAFNGQEEKQQTAPQRRREMRLQVKFCRAQTLSELETMVNGFLEKISLNPDYPPEVKFIGYSGGCSAMISYRDYIEV